MNLLWLVRAHIPSPAFALRTHKKSAGAAQIVSIKQIPDQKQKQKNKKRERKRKILLFFSLTHLRERFNYNRGCMQALE